MLIMASNLNLKKIFLICIIISLILSALIGIFVFLFGEFRRVEVRLLLNTLAIGFYSLSGLSCSAIIEKHRFRTFATLGIIISACGLLYTSLYIWEGIDIDNGWKPLIIFFVLAFGVAHICPLLLIRSKIPLVNFSLVATIICISILDFMLICLILDDFNMNEFYFRLLGVFAILDVRGSIVTPIMHKIHSKESVEFQIIDK